MTEKLSKFLEIARGAWRFRWMGMAVAWVVAFVCIGLLMLLPDIYESRARVYVDTESVLGPLLQNIAVQRDVESQVRMMATVLRSRPTLEQVADETGLSKRAKTAQQHDALIGSLAKDIKLESTGKADNFAISYRDSDRFMAQRVVKTALEAFMQQTVGIRRNDSGAASKFLREQIADYETRLTEAEHRLAEFKKNNVGLMPGQAGDYFTRLQTMMADLEKLQSRYNQLESRRSELARQLSGESPTYAGADAHASSIAEQIAQLQKKLETLLAQYTDKHPEVVTLREQIQHLQGEMRKPPAEAPAASVITTTGVDGRSVAVLNVNPVYQNMRLTMATTDAEIAELRGQIGEQQRVTAALRQKVNIVPDVEAELAQLNRDYDVNKAQHTALLQRLESARITGEAGESSDRTKFQIIEPPIVPPVPVLAPGRMVYAIGVLVVSLICGAAAAVGVFFLRPAFYSTATFRAAIPGRYLGSVSVIDFHPERSWFRKPVPQFCMVVMLLTISLGGGGVMLKYVRPHIQQMMAGSATPAGPAG